MANVKITVNFSVLKAPEGLRVMYTQYEIDPDGNIIRDNIKGSFAVMDETLRQNIQAVEEFINARES